MTTASRHPDPPPPAERRVRLFRNGRSQAVRIPRDLELPGEEVVIRKEGDRLIIEAVVPTAVKLRALLATFETIDEDIGEIADPPPDDVDPFA
jgi:antitoxin VapB